MRQLSAFATVLVLGLLPAVAAAQQPAPAPVAPPVPAPAPKKAEKAAKVSSVCPAKVLPLAVGNTWTYQSVTAPTTVPENMVRLLPPRAKTITITVTAVDVKPTETTVKLSEKLVYDISRDVAKGEKLVEQTNESTIVCTPKGKFDISPESFFFAGEPGGYRGLVFDKLERKKETSFKLTNGTFGEQEWIEEIVGFYTKESVKGSNAKLGKGKLELERKFTPQHPEMIATRYGTWMAEKLGITTTGRITLENKHAPDGKPCSQKKLEPGPKPTDPPTEITIQTELCELPANWISQLWLVENVGVVQTLNMYAHMYQLLDAKLN